MSTRARGGATGSPEAARAASSPRTERGGADEVEQPLVDSAVTQDYLKAVWAASEWGGRGASITGLARHMGVAPSTASENVARLVEAGLIEHEPYRAVTLTDEGRRRAMAMVRRHRLLETYLVRKLGFRWDEVHPEAEVLEHAVSDRLLEALAQALGNPLRDPHGDPIPTADGQLVEPTLRSLDTVRVGETVVVGRIKDDPQTLQHLEAARIGLDSLVTVIGRPTAQGEDQGRQRKATVIRAARPLRSGQTEPLEPCEAVVAAGSVWVLA